jgi:hypothetical protein
MVAVFIHLEDAEVENGCLAVYPGVWAVSVLSDYS